MSSVPPVAFSHVGFHCFDLPKMESFYKRVLGLLETDRGEARGQPLVFLSRNANEHHQVVLVGGRTGERTDKLLNQLSFRVDSLADLRRFLAAVQAEPEVTDIAPVNHGVAWSIYFRDPEGNRIELFVDSPFYVTQPLIGALDLSQDDATIERKTVEAYALDPGFRTLKDWRESFAVKLES